MPTFPKANKRPWITKTKPQEGRKVTNPFYHTTAWRKFRNAYIQANPLCVDCFQVGKAVPGNVVDHIIQINRVDPYNTAFGHFGEPLCESNVQTLCTHHHAIKSGKERWNK
jgi:hypothetical protein